LFHFKIVSSPPLHCDAISETDSRKRERKNEIRGKKLDRETEREIKENWAKEGKTKEDK
jgi:hypothetical protein